MMEVFGWLGKVVRYEVWLADALCLARIESNWKGGGGKGVCISNERGRRRKYTPESKANQFCQPAVYALFVFFFSFLLLLSFVCERNKKVIN